MSTPTPSPSPRPASAGMSRIKTPRLSGWLLITLALLAAVWAIAPQQLPVSLYKLSLVTLAAVVGYWIDRSLFPYARPAYLLDLQDALVAGSPPLVCDDDDQCSVMATARKPPACMPPGSGIMVPRGTPSASRMKFMPKTPYAQLAAPCTSAARPTRTFTSRILLRLASKSMFT